MVVIWCCHQSRYAERVAESWRSQVAADWAAALEPVAPLLSSIGAFLREEIAAGRGYLPASDVILRAFRTPLAEVRVLIVGQDPYPTPGDPVGLCFSVGEGQPMPRSLINIATELRNDTGGALVDGDLTPWTEQGVMLLNRVLTVRPGASGSHRGKGWEQFTEHAIRSLATRGGPLTAILWGRDAQVARAFLGEVPTIESAHPSPLSASSGFFGSRPFSRANALLEQQGAPPIRWGTAS
jgi:uracil-DNA glycosylase